MCVVILDTVMQTSPNLQFMQCFFFRWHSWSWLIYWAKARKGQLLKLHCITLVRMKFLFQFTRISHRTCLNIENSHVHLYRLMFVSSQRFVIKCLRNMNLLKLRQCLTIIPTLTTVIDQWRIYFCVIKYNFQVFWCKFSVKTTDQNG